MNYADIKDVDVTNGPGIRVSLFVSGCPHHCPGCFNPEAWSYDFGKPFTEREVEQILAMLDRPYIRGFSLLGGEPLALSNQASVLSLVNQVRMKLPDKDIWCYTGFLYEDLAAGKIGEWGRDILSFLDVLVDGPFILEEKDLKLRFRGSSNQRILDVAESFKQGRAVRISEYDN